MTLFFSRLRRVASVASLVLSISFAHQSASVAGVYDTYGSTDPVVLWNAYTLEATKSATTPLNSNVASRVAAIQSLAARDAAYASNGNNALYSGSVTIPAGPIDVRAAVAQASFASAYAQSSDANYRSKLDSRLAESLATIADGPAKTNGIGLGQQIATNLLNKRANDQSTLPYTYTDAVTPPPGTWVRTNPAANAANPTWGQVTPFLLTSVDQFPVGSPPALTSDAYAAAFNEVKQLGSATSATRTAAQTDIAQFWRQDAELPPNQVARQISTAKNLTTLENADLFARLNVALADARIAVWKVKYDELFWRPIQAIRRADEDGNAATAKDENWTSLLPAPNHPSYASGHSVTGAAGFEFLTQYFGTDNVTQLGLSKVVIDTTTAGWTDSTKPGNTFYEFTSFSDAADANGLSRIYGGIHYSFDNEVALALGRQIGDYVASAPIPEPSCMGWLGAALAASAVRRRFAQQRHGRFIA